MSELNSLLHMHGLADQVRIQMIDDVPYCFLFNFPDLEIAMKILSRAVLVHFAMELYAEATDYPTLHSRMKHNAEKYSDLVYSPFKFRVDTFNCTISESEKHELIETFSYMDLKGEVDLKSEKSIEFCIAEAFKEIGSKRNRGTPSFVFFGRIFTYGCRHAINFLSLKKRAYIGTTSMDAEISLIIANQANCQKGSLVMDPFSGTGSLIVACAYFGATVIGGDISKRMLKGKVQNASVITNMRQYGLFSQLGGLLVSDVNSMPFKGTGWLDAIVADPPYGVRAGARKSNDVASVEDLIIPLMQFASQSLVLEGRLVFFLPLTHESMVLPPVWPHFPGLKILDCSEQRFAHWSRFLLTYVRVDGSEAEKQINPCTKAVFRKQYFKNNKK